MPWAISASSSSSACWRPGGLTRAEVTLINIDANLVPEQWRAGVIDVGQTWEPYVSRMGQAEGRVLYTSRETPGLIIDTLQFRGAVLRERPEDVRAFLRAILRAVEHWRAHPEEDNAIIARALAIPLGEAQTLGIKLLNLADNRRAFDRNDPTSLYQSARAYVDFYIRTGSLGRFPDLEGLIDPSFLPAE
ncbi:MAG: ABC transporter substrate-binding protein [Gammaproteobacteria bacterium]